MPSRGILVVAATAAELDWVEGAEALAVGIGPVEAAIGTARRLAADPPALLLHVGIAGARAASGIPVGALVLGEESRYADLAAAVPVVAACRPDAGLLERAASLLPDAVRAPIATAAAVGGGEGCPVEAMEGFAVLRAAELAGVPAVEVRAISNLVEEPDRARWDVAGALARTAEAGRVLVAGLAG
jgi:futalosine hydrolase